MLKAILYSFPVQLLLFQLRRNLLLLSLWALLLGVTVGQWGEGLGIPYLFLAPEYMGQAGAAAMFIMGLAIGTFIMSFHITAYIFAIGKFTFLNFLPRPMALFCLNNGLLPFIFNLLFVPAFIRYQTEYELIGQSEMLLHVLFFFAGQLLVVVLYFIYFRLTGQPLFSGFGWKVDERLRKTKITRYMTLQRVRNIRGRDTQYEVHSYLDFPLKVRSLHGLPPVILHESAKFLDRNQLNALVIELFLFALFLVLGLFRDNPAFQIPAAASGILLLALLIMLAGALTYWLKKWAWGVTVIGMLLFSALATDNGKNPYHRAFGLNYDTIKAEYSLKRLELLNNDAYYAADVASTLHILNNWRAKFPNNSPPKMIFICTSGGGQRAAAWTLRCLQALDSTFQGRVMQQTMLMTGASGGMIGAAYYREIYRRVAEGEITHTQSDEFLERIAKDRLNPLVLSWIVSDLFLPFQETNKDSLRYFKDRGYAFEQKLNSDMAGWLDKPLAAYRIPEQRAQIPMMIIAASVINDGRRLYFASQPISYMNNAAPLARRTIRTRTRGIEFLRFFRHHRADSLRLTTALRMNATFPYIMPNVLLPSEPAMEVMDAGLSDNYGVNDAVQFLYVFREWIAKNTSGVIIIRIRDSPKEREIKPYQSRSLLFKLFSPIEHFLSNMYFLQDGRNDVAIELAEGWFKNDLKTVDFEYNPYYLNNNLADTLAHIRKAPLSWRLTARELDGIRAMIHSAENQSAMRKLKGYLK
ncbi:patatin-like phospholipase family protein [Rhodoflexus caldus]|uniref:patatin-like phospholipase family protein n=1 Tax=Rhodoflexus caldus TaxID=2891236 RepID=UPI00202A648F|nr:patatin-like phospholipase family protein [Rhodoflexus caldus]